MEYSSGEWRSRLDKFWMGDTVRYLWRATYGMRPDEREVARGAGVVTVERDNVDRAFVRRLTRLGLQCRMTPVTQPERGCWATQLHLGDRLYCTEEGEVSFEPNGAALSDEELGWWAHTRGYNLPTLNHRNQVYLRNDGSTDETIEP